MLTNQQCQRQLSTSSTLHLHHLLQQHQTAAKPISLHHNFSRHGPSLLCAPAQATPFALPLASPSLAPRTTCRPGGGFSFSPVLAASVSPCRLRYASRTHSPRCPLTPYPLPRGPAPHSPACATVAAYNLSIGRRASLTAPVYIIHARSCILRISSPNLSDPAIESVADESYALLLDPAGKDRNPEATGRRGPATRGFVRLALGAT